MYQRLFMEKDVHLVAGNRFNYGKVEGENFLIPCGMDSDIYGGRDRVEKDYIPYHFPTPYTVEPA